MNLVSLNAWHRPPEESLPFEDFLCAEGLYARLRAFGALSPAAVDAAFLVYAFVGPNFPGRGRATAISEAMRYALDAAEGSGNLVALEASFVRGLVTVVDSAAGWSAHARQSPALQWRWEEPMWLFWNQRGVSEVAVKRVPHPGPHVLDARRIQVLAALRSARLCEALFEHEPRGVMPGAMRSQNV